MKAICFQIGKELFPDENEMVYHAANLPAKSSARRCRSLSVATW
jgi:hypothetical protein